MKNKIHYLLSYFAILAILTSCQTSSEFNSSALVKKRTYTKGYHLNLASAKYDKPASARAQAASEMTEIAKVAPSEISVTEVESQAVPRLEGLTASAYTSIDSPVERSSEVAHTRALLPML